MIDISIVIPVYNSSEILSELVKKIYQSIKDDFNFEIILINDKSADNSWDKIKELTLNIKIYKELILSRIMVNIMQ